MSRIIVSAHASSRATERGIDLGVITDASSGVHLLWDQNGPFRAHFAFDAGFGSDATLLTVVRPLAAACGAAALDPEGCILPDLARALASVGLGGIADMISVPPGPTAGAGCYIGSESETGTVIGQYRDCADAILRAAPPIMCGRQQQRGEPDGRVASLYRAARCISRAYLELRWALSPVSVWSSDLQPGETRQQAADRKRAFHAEQAQSWWASASLHLQEFHQDERFRSAA